ncbi:DUF1893 domain-containing protein [Lachnospiraceae bacterium 48-33]
MKTDLMKAADTLHIGDYTCVLYRRNEVYTSTERSVKPLLDWLDSGIDLKGFSAADKVVGKAAAFLYVFLGMKEVYAIVISEAAIDTLERNGIQYRYDVSVRNIVNRAGTGNCPMEMAVWNIVDPKGALRAIRTKLKQLMEKAGG